MKCFKIYVFNLCNIIFVFMFQVTWDTEVLKVCLVVVLALRLVHKAFLVCQVTPDVPALMVSLALMETKATEENVIHVLMV